MAGNLVTVLFGDNKSVLLNADCSVANFLEALRRKMGLQHEYQAVLDLADTQGNVQHLHSNLKEPASKFLVGRTNYIVVRKLEDEVVETSGKCRPSENFSPLLLNYSELFPEYQTHTETEVRRDGHRRRDDARNMDSVKKPQFTRA